MYIPDIPSPQPRILSSHFNRGKANALRHVRKHGSLSLEVCALWVKAQKLQAEGGSRVVLSYWSGYRAGLVSYQEQEATDG